MQTRIYIVHNKATNERRLVDASSAPQAVRHVVQDLYTAEVGSARDVGYLIQSGIQIEQAAKSEPKAPAEAPAQA